MAVRRLTAGQQQRLRYELGINVLDIGAEPYIAHLRIIDVITQNLSSDANAVANCSTSVTSVGSVVLTLDSMAGMTQGECVVLDCDDAFERATIKATSGSTITVNCQRLHASTFPVEVESGLTRVIEKLQQLAVVERQLDDIAVQLGVTQAGQVQLGTGKNDALTRLGLKQKMHRRELASLVNLRMVLDSLGFGGGGGGGIGLY